MSDNFVKGLINVLGQTLSHNLNGLSSHLSGELNCDRSKIDQALKKFEWDLIPVYPSTKKTTPDIIKPPSKKVSDIEKKIADAKAVDKFYCVSINRKITASANMKNKYTFYTNLGLAGIDGSPELENALTILGAIDTKPDTQPSSTKTTPKSSPKPKGSKPILRKNKFGNIEDKQTGIVFKNNKAIGVQNYDEETIDPLTLEEIKICKEKGWRFEINNESEDIDVDEL